MKGLLFLSVGLLVFMAFSSLSAAHHPDERSATFVGSAHFKHRLHEECEGIQKECPVRFPAGSAFVTCDGGDGHEYTAGLYDGIAAVRFCEVPRGAQIEMEFVRLSGVFSTIGLVTCLETDGELSWNTEFARLSDEGPTGLEVPTWCNDESGKAHQDTTYITVFILTADIADATAPAVYAPVEGEIALRILSVGGSG